MRQWGGGTVAVLAAVSACVTLGYGYLAGRDSGPRPASKGKPMSVVCHQPPTYFANNAHYSGPGPHPIAIFQQKNQADTEPTSPVTDGATSRQPDLKSVQLVACSRRVAVVRAEKVCPFSHGHAPLYRATYRVRVIEAASGQSVGEIFVHPKSDTCPAYPVVDQTAPRVFSLPTAEEYALALRQYTDWPAGSTVDS